MLEKKEILFHLKEKYFIFWKLLDGALITRIEALKSSNNFDCMEDCCELFEFALNLEYSQKQVKKGRIPGLLSSFPEEEENYVKRMISLESSVLGQETVKKQVERFFAISNDELELNISVLERILSYIRELYSCFGHDNEMGKLKHLCEILLNALKNEKKQRKNNWLGKVRNVLEVHRYFVQFASQLRYPKEIAEQSLADPKFVPDFSEYLSSPNQRNIFITAQANFVYSLNKKKAMSQEEEVNELLEMELDAQVEERTCRLCNGQCGSDVGYPECCKLRFTEFSKQYQRYLFNLYINLFGNCEYFQVFLETCNHI